MDPQAAPGWYPDPRSRAHIRWWDGRQWTDAVQPATSTGWPLVGQLPARSHPGRVALISIASVLAFLFLGAGAWAFGRAAGDPVSARASHALAPVAPWSPPTVPTPPPAVLASPAVVTPSAAAGSPSAGAKASILATRAAELSGTAYVAIDGSVSMVESSEWVSLPSEPSAQDLPGLTAHGSWSLSSHGPAAGDFAALSTQELTASIGLDSYAHASARGLADALDGYELVSEEHVTNIYGDPARLIRYRCTIAGVKTEGLDYLVISGRTAAGFTLMTSPARFDAVVAGVMPFISTLRVPADA